MLWQAGTLDRVLDRLDPFTGKAASAGSSSSQGTENTPSNSSSKVLAGKRLSRMSTRSAQRRPRLAAAIMLSSPEKAMRPSVTCTFSAPSRRTSKAAVLSVPK